YRTPDHIRHRKLINGATKEDAERELREIFCAVDNGTYADPRRAPAFTAFCATFDKRHGQHKIMYRRDSNRIERLKKYFGDRKLSDITSGMIESYRLDRIEKGRGRDGQNTLAPATVNREVMILRAMFNKAVKWGMLARNPAQSVEDYDEGE